MKQESMSLKTILAKVANFFATGKAESVLNAAADHAALALPYIDMAAQLIAGVTPTTLDDQALAMVTAKYPRLFDGSIKTGSELKLYALGVAGDLMNAKYPALSTTIARTAVQLAYAGKTA